MSMMSSIAGASVSLSSAELMQQYSVSVTKKAMDTQEAMAQKILEMLPQQAAPAKGRYIDTYA